MPGSFGMMRALNALLLLLCLCFVLPPAYAQQSTSVEAIANLADPAKLATLAERGANPRVQKITYWLAVARANGEKPDAVIDAAFSRFGWKGTPQGEITKETLLRNLAIAEERGCLDAAGMEDMRRGQAPTIRFGTSAGDQLSVDHTIARAVIPELDNVLANLELMPLQMNMAKNAKILARQYEFARRLIAAGLLTAEAAAPILGKPAPSLASRPVELTPASSPPPPQAAPPPQSLPALTAPLAAQGRAVARFPELQIAGSPLHQVFFARANAYRTTKPELFTNPEWPSIVGAEAFAEWKQAGVTPPKQETPVVKEMEKSVANAPPAILFYASKNSKVFHETGCRSIATIAEGNLVIYKTREEAIAAGKRPCAICQP